MNVSPFNSNANGPSRSHSTQSRLPSYNTDTYDINFKINNGIPLGTKFQRRIIPLNLSPTTPHSTYPSPLGPPHPAPHPDPHPDPHPTTMTPAPHHHHHHRPHSSTTSALQQRQLHHRRPYTHADALAAVARSGPSQPPREPHSVRDYGYWYTGRGPAPRGPSVVRSGQSQQQYSPPQQRSADAELNIRGTSAYRGHDVPTGAGVSTGTAARGRGSNVWVAPAVLAAQQQRRVQAVSGQTEPPRRDADGDGNTARTARTGPVIDASRELRARRRADAATTTTTTSTQTQRPRHTTSGTQTSPQPLANPRPSSPPGPSLHRQPPCSPYPHYQAPTHMPSITREIATREEAARVHARRGEREKWLRNRDALEWLKARAGALREEEGQERRDRERDERGAEERRGEAEAEEGQEGEGSEAQDEGEWEEICTPSSSSSPSGSSSGYEQVSRDGNARGDSVSHDDSYKAGITIAAANANARRESQRRHSEADPYMYGDAASDVEDLLDYGWGLERGDRGGRS
ncbi:hypothetical protein BKA80DRAFT_251902 [Phyllosticta citrichinensis]